MTDYKITIVEFEVFINVNSAIIKHLPSSYFDKQKHPHKILFLNAKDDNNNIRICRNRSRNLEAKKHATC